MINFLPASVVSNIGEFLSGSEYETWKSLTVSGPAGIVASLIKLALILLSVVFFAQFLHGAVNWMISAGNAEQLQKAQRELTSALVGLVIVFSAWAILNLVNYFFGLSGMGAGAPTGGSGQTCLYCENCEASTSKTHQCHGTIQGRTCKYNPKINPNCSSCKTCGDGSCDVCEGKDWCPKDCH